MVWWQHDDSRSQELIERKIKNAPAGQGTVRMLSHEEWEEIREVRPRTPFESKLARPNAQIRTGEQLRKVRLFIIYIYSTLLSCLVILWRRLLMDIGYDSSVLCCSMLCFMRSFNPLIYTGQYCSH